LGAHCVRKRMVDDGGDDGGDDGDKHIRAPVDAESLSIDHDRKVNSTIMWIYPFNTAYSSTPNISAKIRRRDKARLFTNGQVTESASGYADRNANYAIMPPSTATGSGQCDISAIFVVLPRFIPRASSVQAVQWSVRIVFEYANSQVCEGSL
jgi:hypothetical protein